MITEIASASAELFKLINDAANRSQAERLDEAKDHATRDVEVFKQAVLSGSLERVNLQLGGLRHGILVRLTDGESRALGDVRPEIDGVTLLALYARGRAADLAAECGEIVRLYGNAGGGA